MPSIELDLNFEQIKEGIRPLNTALRNNFTRDSITNTFNYNMGHSTWPSSYYKMRDEIFPMLLGEEASKLFFFFLFGGFLMHEKIDEPTSKEIVKLQNSFDENNIQFLYYILINYGKDILKAKKYNTNPIGYDELQISFSGEDEFHNLIISRNDNSNFLLKINSADFCEIITDLTEYYSKILNIQRINITEENISIIRGIIKKLSSIIGDNINE